MALCECHTLYGCVSMARMPYPPIITHNPVAGGLLLCCAVLSRSSCSGCFAEVAYECYVEDECGVGCARRG